MIEGNFCESEISSSEGFVPSESEDSADEGQDSRGPKGAPKGQHVQSSKALPLPPQSSLDCSNDDVSAELKDLVYDGRKFTQKELDFLAEYRAMRMQLSVTTAQKLGCSVAFLESLEGRTIKGVRAANAWDGFQMQYSATHSKPRGMSKCRVFLSVRLSFTHCTE